MAISKVTVTVDTSDVAEFMTAYKAHLLELVELEDVYFVDRETFLELSEMAMTKTIAERLKA